MFYNNRVQVPLSALLIFIASGYGFIHDLIVVVIKSIVIASCGSENIN